MSPRRKVTPDEPLTFTMSTPAPHLRWRFPAATCIAAIAALASITLCVMVLSSQRAERRDSLRDIEAVGYVQSFMTEFTSPDPFHANDYADRILAHSTGRFADYYREHQNEILIGVARSEPTTGEVVDTGVSRRNDDGSVEVLVVTKLSATSTDGALHMERSNRWVVTTREEGQRWKISDLIPMM